MLERGRAHILDALGLALAGAGSRTCRIARGHVAGLGIAARGASVLGTAEKTAPRFAALVNAAAMHADNFDDTNPQIQQIALNNNIRLLALDESKFDHASWRKYNAQPGRILNTIGPDIYGENQVNTEPVVATGAWVGLAARASIPAEKMYRMVKAFWEHIDEAHAMAKWMKAAVNIEHAAKHTAGAIHPGAARYYRERGIEIETPYMLVGK